MYFIQYHFDFESCDCCKWLLVSVQQHWRRKCCGVCVEWDLCLIRSAGEEGAQQAEPWGSRQEGAGGGWHGWESATSRSSLHPHCQTLLQRTWTTGARSARAVWPPGELWGFYEEVMTALKTDRFPMLTESGLACGGNTDEPGSPTLEDSDAEEGEDEPMAPLASNSEDLGSDEDNLSTGQDSWTLGLLWNRWQ